MVGVCTVCGFVRSSRPPPQQQYGSYVSVLGLIGRAAFNHTAGGVGFELIDGFVGEERVVRWRQARFVGERIVPGVFRVSGVLWYTKKSSYCCGSYLVVAVTCLSWWNCSFRRLIVSCSSCLLSLFFVWGGGNH